MTVDEKEYLEILKKSCKENVRLIESELPLAEAENLQEQENWIRMKDGVKLFARVVRPKENGRYPVILIRTPYKLIDFTDSIQVVPVFVRRGYIVVYNHVRGTGRSEGKWEPFKNERSDGLELIEWISGQSWCDGNIGTWGSSYSGYVQWCIADCRNPMLKTMFLSMFGPDPYGYLYRRGMFRQDVGTGWSATMMGENRYRIFRPEEEARLRNKAYGISPQTALGQKLIGEECRWYTKWGENDFPDSDYWNSDCWGELKEIVDRIRIPLFLHGGWYDVMLRAQIHGWRSLPQDIKKKSCFMIGPWNHVLSTDGVFDHPGENGRGLARFVEAAVEWFDRYLKGMDGKHLEGGVEVYAVGAEKWMKWKEDLYSDSKIRLYFHCGKENAGILKSEPEIGFGKTEYLYDPDHPVFSCGGSLLFNNTVPEKPPACSTWQPSIGEREDVISFLSERYQKGLFLSGSVTVRLYVSSSAQSTAFAVKLMEVLPDGQAVNIADDITDIRFRDEQMMEIYHPGTVVELTLHMTDICWRLQKESRIRVDITSSNFPEFHRHPNTEENWAGTVHRRTARQIIYSGTKYPSQIEFPVIR